MSGVSTGIPHGVLRPGWTAEVDDYAIAGGWTQDGTVLVVGDTAGSVYAFEGKSGAGAWSQKETHDGGLLAMSVHPSNRTLATAGQDGKVLVWDIAGGQVERTIDVGSGWVDNLAWSPDGEWLAASCSRQVHVYGADGGELWCSEDHPSTISAIAWSSSGELATACYGRVAFFDGASGKVGQKLEWKGSLVSMVLSSDGDIVACGSQDNSVHFWRRSTAQDSLMGGYHGKPSALAFDAGGGLLATGGGKAVTVWSFHGGGPEGTRPGVLDLHVKPITKLAFAQRGMRLASAARDGIVVVWELRRDGEGQPIGAAGLADIGAELYWRPDGRALAALDARGGVTTWRIG
jgi:WD40 repeat protein